MDVTSLASLDVDAPTRADQEPASVAAALAYASVLIELGSYHEAEHQISEALDQAPSSLRALSLLAKVKHIRGALSQTIACWAQIYGASPPRRSASSDLAALLHLAGDQPRCAVEPVALGFQPLAKRPLGPLALQEAFRLFAVGRVAEATRRAQDVATKYQHQDRATYKLALLAISWICELSGDIDGSSNTLEAMGKERGFERDDDRLLALARVYEMKGTYDDLEKAVKIFSYLQQNDEAGFGPPSPWLGNLVALHQRLGQSSTAQTYAKRSLAAYRQQMHRPSFDETVRVAAQVYVSLPSLLSISFSSHEIAGSLSAREGALASILSGTRDDARAALESGNEAVDQKYLGDLARIDGDHDRAFTLYLSSLEQDPDDLQIIGHLLQAHAFSPRKSIARYFSQPEIFERTRLALQAAARRAPLHAGQWEQMAELQSINQNSRTANTCIQRSRELASAAQQKSHPVGRALSASVYHFVGQAHGLIHEIWTYRNPVDAGMGGTLPADHILGNVTAEMTDGIRNTFFAVREYARTMFPSRTADLFNYNYTFKVPKEDEPSGGLSAGLPAVLAFLSVFLQRPIPQNFASSGVVVADAHDVLTIRRVGEVEHKVNAAYHHNLDALLLPSENADELRANAQIPSEVCDELVHYFSNVDEAVKWVFGADVFVQA